MAALRGASMAIDNGRGFIVKGQKVGFILVNRMNDHIKWYVVYNNGKLVWYKDL